MFFTYVPMHPELTHGKLAQLICEVCDNFGGGYSNISVNYHVGYMVGENFVSCGINSHCWFLVETAGTELYNLIHSARTPSEIIEDIEAWLETHQYDPLYDPNAEPMPIP